MINEPWMINLPRKARSKN